MPVSPHPRHLVNYIDYTIFCSCRICGIASGGGRTPSSIGAILKLVAAIAVVVIGIQTVTVSGKITNPISSYLLLNHSWPGWACEFVDHAIFSVQQVGAWDRNITLTNGQICWRGGGGGGGGSLRTLHLKEWHLFRTKKWFMHLPSFWIFQVIYVKLICPNLFQDATHHSLHLKIFKNGPNYSQSTFHFCVTRTKYWKRIKFTRSMNNLVVNCTLSNCFKMVFKVANNFSFSFCLLFHISHVFIYFAMIFHKVSGQINVEHRQKQKVGTSF